eukprot:246548-Rhodomonas_salina.1
MPRSRWRGIQQSGASRGDVLMQGRDSSRSTPALQDPPRAGRGRRRLTEEGPFAGEGECGGSAAWHSDRISGERRWLPFYSAHGELRSEATRRGQEEAVSYGSGSKTRHMEAEYLA